MDFKDIFTWVKKHPQIKIYGLLITYFFFLISDFCILFIHFNFGLRFNTWISLISDLFMISFLLEKRKGQKRNV